MPHRFGALVGLPPTANSRLTSQTCLALAEAAVQEGKLRLGPAPCPRTHNPSSHNSQGKIKTGGLSFHCLRMPAPPFFNATSHNSSILCPLLQEDTLGCGAGGRGCLQKDTDFSETYCGGKNKSRNMVAVSLFIPCPCRLVESTPGFVPAGLC